MENQELFVVTVNAIVIGIAYFFVYPVFCGSDGNKIATNDLIASAISLLIVGYNFWDTGVEFSILVTTVNWFWFTFLSYFVIEMPVMLWYFNKHDVWKTFDT